MRLIGAHCFCTSTAALGIPIWMPQNAPFRAGFLRVHHRI